MSIKVITAVLRLVPAMVTPAERLVLYALAWHADEHGSNSWPAVATIARETSLTRRAVQKVLRRLNDKGLVVVQGLAARGSVRYGVELSVLDRERYSQSETDDREPGSQSRATTTANVVQGGANGVHPTANVVQGGGEPGSPDPSLIRPLTVREEVQDDRAGRSPKREESGDRAGATDGSPSSPSACVHHLEPGAADGLGLRPAASAPPAPPEDDQTEAENDDDDAVLSLAELQRIAERLFDELGDDVSMAELEPAFIMRAHIRAGDPFNDHLGSFLYGVRKIRRRPRFVAADRAYGAR